MSSCKWSLQMRWWENLHSCSLSTHKASSCKAILIRIYSILCTIYYSNTALDFYFRKLSACAVQRSLKRIFQSGLLLCLLYQKRFCFPKVILCIKIFEGRIKMWKFCQSPLKLHLVHNDNDELIVHVVHFLGRVF